MTETTYASKIINYLDEILPDAGCELNYTTDYGFVIAVMLSAQCTDKKVNKVTAVLFDKYKTLEELAAADYDDVYKIVLPLGLAKTKAANVIGIAKELLEKYNGDLPVNKVELMQLPGVGNKTANVVHVELFKIPEFPVDTHVERISKRLQIADKDDSVKKVEAKLLEFFPKDKWIKLHHQFIHFGRYICKAQHPDCSNCGLKEHCLYFQNKIDK